VVFGFSFWLGLILTISYNFVFVLVSIEQIQYACQILTQSAYVLGRSLILRRPRGKAIDLGRLRIRLAWALKLAASVAASTNEAKGRYKAELILSHCLRVKAPMTVITAILKTVSFGIFKFFLIVLRNMSLWKLSSEPRLLIIKILQY